MHGERAKYWLDLHLTQLGGLFLHVLGGGGGGVGREGSKSAAAPLVFCGCANDIHYAF